VNVKRRSVPALIFTLIATLAVPGQVSAQPSYPFQDPSRPVEERVEDLLGRLTLDEKLSLLHQSQAAIPRLDLPYFKAGTEALHGVAWSNDRDSNWDQVLAEGTVFPQAVGLASTWDPALVEQVGAAVGAEVRGYNALDPVVWGTQVWSPVVNLLRDPRWGRNEEGYSEDPLLTGAISTAYGEGLSGDDPVYLQAAPVLKHYLAYNNEWNRNLTSSTVPPRVLHEYDEAAFRTPIEADAVTGVMASYNYVNGRPTHVMRDLNEVVRSWTDQTLYNVSDAWAPRALVEAQQYYEDYDEAFANVLKAGLDSFTIDNNDTGPMLTELRSALDKGLLTEADVDTAVRHALTIRTRLGQFDPDGGPYASIGPEVINSPAHQALNRQAAESAIVLLRNAGKRLPLDAAETDSVAVIGPLHDALYRDWYAGNLPYEVTPLDGIGERLGSGATVTGVEGLDRIALRDTATGGYLTATGTAVDNSVVVAAGGSAAAQWDVNDWMGDISTLRNVDNGRYLTGNFGPFNTASVEPDGWFVQQQFRLEEQADGTYLIQYVGYETQESWWWIPEHYVTVGADGTVGTGSKADAARFEREVVSNGASSAAAAAGDADAAVVVVGSHPFVHGRENHDRAGTGLGASQQALIEAVTTANPNTVVVLETSYPVTLDAMDRQPKALLWTTHAGSETGNALASVLFGDTNPAGRLTQTWYRSDAELPADLLTYDIIGSDQTYLYYRGEPQYAFGHGLSYTSFRYGKLRLSRPSVGADGTVRVSVDVTNTGRRAGDEVVQLYTHQRSSRDKVPVRQLQAFERVSLAPGQTATVRFTLDAAELAHWDVTRDRWVVESSTYDLLVGASAADIRQRAALRVRGETIPPRDLSAPTRAENFDGYAGVTLADQSKEAGTVVAATGAGDWVVYRDAALGRRSTTFTASVAKGSEGAGTIEIRLDSPTGRLVGTVSVPSTGDVYAYTAVTGSLSKARGTRDVYLVFDSDIRLATFSID
jgi:beta-glucosidase